VGERGRICQRAWPEERRKSRNRPAPLPISPTPHREGREARWRRTPQLLSLLSQELF